MADEAPDNEEISPEVEAQRAAALADMGAPTNAGESVIRPQADYFGCDETFDVFLPDGVSYFTHKKFTEGARRKYLTATNRDIKLDQKTNVASLRATPGDDRRALLDCAIVGWHLLKDGKSFPYNDSNKRVVLDSFPPEVLDLVVEDIHKHNKWLGADVSVEDIDNAIADLQIRREELVKEQEGKGSS